MAPRKAGVLLRGNLLDWITGTNKLWREGREEGGGVSIQKRGGKEKDLDCGPSRLLGGNDDPKERRNLKDDISFSLGFSSCLSPFFCSERREGTEIFCVGANCQRAPSFGSVTPSSTPHRKQRLLPDQWRERNKGVNSLNQRIFLGGGRWHDSHHPLETLSHLWKLLQTGGGRTPLSVFESLLEKRKGRSFLFRGGRGSSRSNRFIDKRVYKRRKKRGASLTGPIPMSASKGD